ncbi:MAG: DUF1294 domain-containing protein [Ruminococcus sp.]|nr:DUF1294 domain-containing protein [Ruminococcus sp.]
MSVITFFVYGADKLGAKINDPKKRHTRVPEAVLLNLAFFGGAWGAALGMLVFHHKIRKPRFRLLVPIAVILWTAAPAVLFFLINHYTKLL